MIEEVCKALKKFKIKFQLSLGYKILGAILYCIGYCIVAFRGILSPIQHLTIKWLHEINNGCEIISQNEQQLESSIGHAPQE